MTRHVVSAEHGSRTMYDYHGCRCSKCRTGNRKYQRELRARLKDREPPKHGFSGYVNYGCRCWMCTAANTDHSRDFAAKRRAQVTA